jgi:osmotically-inducible protein OsmY
MEVNMATLLRERSTEAFGSSAIVEVAKDRLQRRLNSASKLVICTCSRGILLLRGDLPTYYQKQLAQEAVKGLDGVSQVVNEIQVSE